MDANEVERRVLAHLQPFMVAPARVTPNGGLDPEDAARIVQHVHESLDREGVRLRPEWELIASIEDGFLSVTAQHRRSLTRASLDDPRLWVSVRARSNSAG